MAEDPTAKYFEELRAEEIEEVRKYDDKTHSLESSG